MRVALDASVLVYLFDENASAPIDPSTGQPVTHCKERVSYLISELQRSKARIIVPAPALAEVLVYAGAAGPEWLRILSTSRHFRIAPFDELAAVEFAAIQRERIAAGRQSPGSRRKIKFDEQIVSIAIVEQAELILSDDNDIRRIVGERASVRGMADLELPPEDAQTSLDFSPNEDQDTPEA